MPTLGAEGVGVGWCGAACVDAALLALYTKREVRLSILASLVSPTSAAAIAVALGWWLATAIDSALIGSPAAIGAVTIAYPLCLAVLCPHDLRDTYGVLRRGLRRQRKVPAEFATVAGPRPRPSLTAVRHACRLAYGR